MCLLSGAILEVEVVEGEVNEGVDMRTVRIFLSSPLMAFIGKRSLRCERWVIRIE